MRRAVFILASAIALLLAGCSSGGNTIFERMAPMVQQQVFGDFFSGESESAGDSADGGAEGDPGSPRVMSRADLDRIPFATIRLQHGETPAAYIVPIADNGGYLAYQDSVNRGITLHGGLITATHGFGHDLDSVTHRRDDPTFTPTPPDEWPDTIARSYGFNIRGESSFDITVQCSFNRGPVEAIEIVERRFQLLRIVERCANARRQFTNTYWVDARSGFIWKSEQWVGPRIPAMMVEIVRPFRRN